MSNVFNKFDPFCEKLIVNSKEEGLIPLKLWLPQIYFLRQLLRGFERGIFEFIVNKSRQGGITTVDLAILIYWMNKYPGTLAAMTADCNGNIVRARSILTTFMDYLPPEYHIGHANFGHHNNVELQLDNLSVCAYLIAGKRKKSTDSGDLGQGKGFNFSIATEVASYADPKQIDKLKDSFARRNPRKLYIWESTPNGFNHWYDMWKTAEAAIAQQAIFLGWWLHPYYRVEKGSNEYRVYWDGGPNQVEKAWIKDAKRLYGKEFREVMGYDLEISAEQLAWYRWQLHEEKRDDMNALFQEHPPTAELGFIMSGYRYFTNERLTDACAKAIKLPYEAWRYTFGNDFIDTRVHKTNAANVQLRIWDQPVANGMYVLGGDPAFGYNPDSDQSVIEVYRCYADRLIQVAEFCATGIRTDQFAWVILHLCGWYKNIMFNLEIDGPGQAVLSELKHVKKMQSLLRSRGEWNFADTQAVMKHFLYSRQDTLTSSFAYHTKTTHDEKERMMGDLKSLFETERMELKSTNLLTEMKYFARVDGSLQGNGGEYDDRVLSTGLATAAYVRFVRMDMIRKNQTYALVTNAETNKQSETRSAVIDFLKERGVTLK